MLLFSPNHPVGRALSFLLDALLISVLWAVLSAPILTLGATTSALYSVALNWVRRREDFSVRCFLRALKENFYKGTCIWLVLLVPLLLILANGYLIWFSQVLMPWFARWSFFVAAFLWLATATHVFALQATFENTVRRTIGNALRIALMKLPYTLLMLVFHGSAVFLSILFLPAAILLLPASVFLTAYFNWNVLKTLVP